MSNIKDPAKEFEQLLKQRLRDTPFDLVDRDMFAGVCSVVMAHLPLSAIGCDWPTRNEIKEIVEGKREANLYHVSFALNGFERISPALAGLSEDYYTQMMDYVYERGTEWNKQVEPIKNSVMRKMQSDAELKGRIVQPNKGLIGHKN